MQDLEVVIAWLSIIANITMVTALCLVLIFAMWIKPVDFALFIKILAVYGFFTIMIISFRGFLLTIRKRSWILFILYLLLFTFSCIIPLIYVWPLTMPKLTISLVELPYQLKIWCTLGIALAILGQVLLMQVLLTYVRS